MTILLNSLTRQQWAERISEAWNGAGDNMLGAIFSIGNDLIESKEGPQRLPHGEFGAMISDDLPFNRITAHKFMKVAADPRLSNVSIWKHLPPNWTTLYELSRLEDSEFDQLLEDGIIRRDMTAKEINKVRRVATVEADEERILNIEPVIGKFRTIVLDPAWEYDWLSLAGRAKPGYAMQTHEELMALDVAAWADEQEGCHLYCWVTNNFMTRACDLVEHWGFQHRTILTWIKPPPFGLGSYFRNSTEHCIFATRGATTTRPAAASISTHFEAPRGEHSEKPEKFYEIVRASSYPPYGEGNQREPRADFVNLFEQQREAAE
jgi:N6-adenosine-specific RNA methylase IME4